MGRYFLFVNSWKKKLYPFFLLGRVSNLPTVWSNCVAGWYLGGGQNVFSLLLICVSGTLLYVGGMYLNDACDAQYDSIHRPNRPIPSGMVSRLTVWLLGILWMVLGTAIAFSMEKNTVVVAVLLVISILLYDFIHKKVTWSPVVMAFNRFFLYLLAATVAVKGITFFAILGAAGLAIYITGVSYLARMESSNKISNYWPLLLLFTPLLFAWLKCMLKHEDPIMYFLPFFTGAWILWALSAVLARSQKDVVTAINRLLAGIILVDMLAMSWSPTYIFIVFPALFVLAIIMHKKNDSLQHIGPGHTTHTPPVIHKLI